MMAGISRRDGPSASSQDASAPERAPVARPVPGSEQSRHVQPFAHRLPEAASLDLAWEPGND